jgi:predicted AlkP superfamily pyrophosphatase or phosphodiesterase
VIANGFFDRDRRTVQFWVAHNDVIAGQQIWDVIHARRPDFSSAVWHAQNIKGAGADFIVTPAPIHEADGSTKLWCYSKPDGLYEQLLDTMGHFPLQHYWGPLANIESTRWILGAAVRLIEMHAPNYHWIYIPHLDYAAQKFGPNSAEAKTALVELDRELAVFARAVTESSIGDRVAYLVAGEYALTDVTGVIHPNRVLREAGLLSVRRDGGCEFMDFENSAAFAMVDHQLAHVYLNTSEPQVQARCVELFRGLPGVAGVYAGDDRNRISLDHKRSGEIILVAKDTHWFAYYWWLDDAAAPPFARTVDIHSKPGYDAVELFFDPVARGIPLDAALVKGSHGAPVTASRHRTALICSVASGLVQSGGCYCDTDMKRITLELLGINAK